MEMKIVFPENTEKGHKVHALVGNHTIKTDQPKSYGADDSAPAPFLLFLGAIGTCSGWFLLRFLEARNLSVEGIELIMSTKMDKETKMLPEIKFTVKLPESFPEKYRKPLVSAIHQCAVTRHMMTPPTFKSEVEVNGEIVVSKTH